MKRSFVVAGFLSVSVLAVFNFLLLKQSRSLQSRLNELQSPPKNSPDKIFLWLTSANSPICQFTLQKKGEENYQPPLSLLVFLHQQDCVACLEEAEIWETLYKQFSPKGFYVLGIVQREDSLWADNFARDYELTFPIAVFDSLMLESLGIPPVTPFKIMVDSLHRVVRLSGPNSEPEEQKNFGEVAEKLCRAYLLPG